MNRTSSLKENNFIFQYQKELKTKVLHYINLELLIEERNHKQLVEKEAQKAQANTPFMLTYQIDDHGKIIVEDPLQPKPLATLNTLMKSIA